MLNNLKAEALDLIDASINEIEAKLSKGHINAALGIVREVVSCVIANSSYTDRIVSSPKLDQLCSRIGHLNLANLKLSSVTHMVGKVESPKIVYIVSRIRKSGGHTRIMLDFIHAQPNKEHIILITGVGGQSDIDFLNHRLSGSKNVVVMYAPKKNLQLRLCWLQNILLNISSEHVYLFNNHEDSVAISAMVPDLQLKASFYHHGDHHLCLGVHLNQVRHIDPHPMGYHRCRQDLNIDNIYIPFSVDDNGIVDKWHLDELNFITATAARYNKIEVPYHISYLEVIPQVLKVTGGVHLHIGKLTPWALYSIRRQIKKLGIALDRFIYVDNVLSVWKTLQEFNVNLYIASFPYGAGLTLIEAMGAGIPVILHKHQYSRVLSSLELAYPEAFSWGEPNELYRYLSSLSIERLKSEGEIARIWYEKNYRPERLSRYFSKPNPEEFHVPPLGDSSTLNIKIVGETIFKHRLTQISKFIVGVMYKWINNAAR